jgi:hypothetical protein
MIEVRHIIAAALLLAPPAWAGSVTLAWDAVEDSRVGGYQILYGTQSGQYTHTLDVPGQATTIVTVSGLVAGTDYWFVARARNADASEVSAYSNEVTTIIRRARCRVR